jgi:hypothetical protein
MLMKAVFEDGSFIKGDRKWHYIPMESPGTHHIKVTESRGCEIKIADSEGAYINNANIDSLLIGKRIAIPITKPKYWVIG